MLSGIVSDLRTPCHVFVLVIASSVAARFFPLLNILRAIESTGVSLLDCDPAIGDSEALLVVFIEVPGLDRGLFESSL